MISHDWSDENFDWKGLNWCCDYLQTNLVRWGRIQVRQVKEKWGGLRCYCSFGWDQLHSITHPGHCYSRYPKWLWTLDCLYFSRVVPVLFNWWVVPYQTWLYRKLYSDCVKKYPHLHDEILDCADYPELLRGL